MRNYIAVQSFAWGSGDKEPAAQAEYEVRVIDGEEHYRSYPDGKKDLVKIPYRGHSFWVIPGDDWSRLPIMVGTEFRIKVQQAADVVVNERWMKVFQYYSSAEDKLCPFEPTEDFVFFTVSHMVEVACYGEVWTDEDTNIIRISEHLELSDNLKAYRGWDECEVVLTYGWLKLADEPPRLVPLTIFTEARYKNKHITWCRGQLRDYQIFTSRVKIVANN